jgi:hypothetical protein
LYKFLCNSCPPLPNNAADAAPRDKSKSCAVVHDIASTYKDKKRRLNLGLHSFVVLDNQTEITINYRIGMIPSIITVDSLNVLILKDLMVKGIFSGSDPKRLWVTLSHRSM